jgi:signal transduction histidine kinase/CheY-like chemotaxis protein/pSer/pThr/pTyr-binding forkhead associated (FHA) protein
MPTLTLISWGDARRYALGDRTTIGRDPQSTVLLSDPLVSRRHAAIDRTAEGVYRLVDLGSTHGTFVQGQRVTDHTLHDGDVITIGATRLRFEEGEAFEEEEAARTAQEAVLLHVKQRLPVVSELQFPPEKEVASQEDIRRDYEKLRLAYELARTLGVELDLPRLLEQTLEAAFQLLAAERGAILLIEPRSGRAGVQVARTRQGEDEEITISSTILHEVITQKSGVLLADAGTDRRFSRAGSIMAQGIRSAMCVPMLCRGEVLGAMYLDSKVAANVFSSQDLELFTTIACQAALHIKNATLRERIQDVVFEERRRLERVVRDLPSGLLMLDADSRILLANREAERILALFTRARTGDILTHLGPHPIDNIPERKGSGYVELVAPGPRKRVFVASRARSSDNQFAPAETVILIHEVTLEREREQQAARTERMTLVGQLAGGIAHDFNNLVSIILNYAEFLQAEVQGTSLEADLRVIREAGQKAGQLTRQLLAFSRQEVVKPRVLDLNRIVTGMETLLRRALREDIRISLELSPDLGSVRADPGRVEQVLMNLAVNAQDAMPTGGTLTIETRSVTLSEDRIHEVEQLPAGRYVALVVRDTGIGMSPEVAARVFEPFFTTKTSGQGTGLGLATVYGIVKQAGGNVWVESTPGVGSTFHVLFPSTEEQPSPERTARNGDLFSGGGRRILVVEDEEHVRLLTSRILKEAGYTVVEACDGPEALRLVTEDLVAVDLLVTDVVLPQMSGTELARRLHEKRADLPVLFMSGYADSLDRYGLTGDTVAFLQKPFTPRDLLAQVKDALVARAQ